MFLSENSYISQCLVGNHICTKPVFKVCVCVCARHILKDGITPSVVVFSENSLLPVAICAIFSREQFPSSALRRKKRDIAVIRSDTVLISRKAHLTAHVS